MAVKVDVPLPLMEALALVGLRAAQEAVLAGTDAATIA